MKRMSVVVAAALVLLLPLEATHCAWMGLRAQPASAAVTPPSGHDCCQPPTTPEPAHQSRPEKAPEGCLCQFLPTATLTNHVVVGTEASATTSVAGLPTSSIMAPVSPSTETPLALDIGRPSLPDDPGAHGLRAPPVSG